MYIYIYIYIYIHTYIGLDMGGERGPAGRSVGGMIRLGNPRRAQMFQFELFELILALKINKQLPVERFEANTTILQLHGLIHFCFK